MGIIAAWGTWRGLKLATRLVSLVLTAIVGYLAVTGVQVWLTSRRSEPVPAQAVVIMGSAQYNGVPSPDLLARLREAKRLFDDRLVPLVVATGSKLPGDRYTEAEASATWLRDNGVPSEDIVEVGGNDSWANLAEAAAALHQRGLDSVLLVTDGFHEDRSLAIATDVGLRAAPVPASQSPITGWGTAPYFAKETFGVAVGRIFGYAHLHTLGERVGAGG